MRKILEQIMSMFNALRRENLGRLFLIIILLIFIGAVGLMLFEPNLDLYSALWLVFATVTTVGYGDVSAQTLGGRIVSIVVMIFGIGILGLFTAAIASIFVERKMKETRGMKSFEFESHIIVCEWNHRARDVIRELRTDPRSRNAPIVLLADIETKPVDDDDLYFIQGSVTEETLSRANLKRADTVVILGNDSLSADSRDARVVLAVLTVESLNPGVYTIVELVDEANVKHCERARADEIIVGSEFSSRLISRAAVDHGITKVLSELLSLQYGNDLSKIPLPKEMAGKVFIDIFSEFKRQSNCTILAVQRGDTGEVFSNPPAEFVLAEGDNLIVIKSGEGGSRER